VQVYAWQLGRIVRRQESTNSRSLLGLVLAPFGFTVQY